MPKPSPDDTYSEAETVARREAALKRAFSMPHKPQEPIGGRANKKADREGAAK